MFSDSRGKLVKGLGAVITIAGVIFAAGFVAGALVF